MSQLLEMEPYGPREDAAFLQEMNALTQHHRQGCPPFARIWPGEAPARATPDLPYLHVGLFKHVPLRTEGPHIVHERTLLSSATTSTQSSRIVLDRASSALQARSSTRILADFIGTAPRPLLVLDTVHSLRRRDEVAARTAAAMSLKPFATQIHFLYPGAEPTGPLAWEQVIEAAATHDALLVYGFTWILWTAWAGADVPASVRQALAGKRVHFVHSGGWKKMAALQVARAEFNARLRAGLHPTSRVIDCYGLVEQVGVLYPLCDHGSRHVPAWADVVVRDPFTLAPSPPGEIGILQLLNVLALGAPYHSVLTEDLGRLLPGACPCGRQGRRFELVGRVPSAEVRGCANV